MGENKLVVQDFHDRILNEAQYDNSGDLVYEDTIFSMNQNESLVGIQSFKVYMGHFQQAFPDLTFSTKLLTEENDIVTLHWEAAGTQTNPLGQIPATGKKVSIRGLSLFYLKDGRITENIVYFNEMEIPKQLGVL